MARFLVTISWEDEAPDCPGWKFYDNTGAELNMHKSRSKETLEVHMSYVPQSEVWEIIDRIRIDKGYGKPWYHLDFAIDFMYKLED